MHISSVGPFSCVGLRFLHSEEDLKFMICASNINVSFHSPRFSLGHLDVLGYSTHAWVAGYNYFLIWRLFALKGLSLFYCNILSIFIKTKNTIPVFNIEHVISGFRSGINEVSALLWYCAAWYLPTFRDSLSFPSSRALEYGTICSPETSVTMN